MEKPIERRMFERLPRSFAGTYKLGPNAAASRLSCMDVSGEGARISVDKQIPEDKVLEVEFVSRQAKSPVAITAQLVWQKEVDSGKWHAGLKFNQSSLVSLWPLIENPIEEV